jgi:flagellar basal-body rod protein FlgB
MLNRLTDTLEFQGQALALRSQRQRLIASNIANADTPGYQAREMDFGAALREATGHRGMPSGDSTRNGAALLATTQAGHVAIGGSTLAMAGRTGSGELLYSSAAQTSLDGNSVDMDRERASFADNAVRYEAALRFINGNVRTMLDAIKGQAS